ncbi:MAG: aminotransferase class V-fold PLP-dependent enzyme [Bacilli bacterium]
MNREDFLMLNNDIIYFDNSATTFKPKQVLDKMMDYYNNYCSNIHRGDYAIAMKAEEEYDQVRTKIKNLINAKRSSEIVFTSGATESLNMIVNGFMRYYLKKNDEVIISKSEHASNILPWMVLEKEIGIKVKYVPLDSEYGVTIDNLINTITPNTKVISLAHITNVLGDVRDIDTIGKICKEKNILFVVDAAQSLGHKKIDVENISFLVASAHKMLGPTGVGLLYGKYELLNRLVPTQLGGGMNAKFTSDGEIELKDLPERLEAGTPNVADVIGFGRAVDYILEVGIDNIYRHELELKKYFLEKIKDVSEIEIYNKNTESGIISFNIKNVFSQDTAVYLNHYNICVRAGNHCAKILKDELHVNNTCRISFYLYNTKDEVDKLVDVLSNTKDLFKVVI